MAEPKNNVRVIRESRLMSKAELARKAGISALTVDRVESGLSCRLDTKRKIILALGMSIEEKDRVFRPDAQQPEESASPGDDGTAVHDDGEEG
jgi:DNA-binding XRE family transcriptional regulator